MTINEFNFAGKKAIVRVDFNVPLDDSERRWRSYHHEPHG